MRLKRLASYTAIALSVGVGSVKFLLSSGPIKAVADLVHALALPAAVMHAAATVEPAIQLVGRLKPEVVAATAFSGLLLGILGLLPESVWTRLDQRWRQFIKASGGRFKGVPTGPNLPDREMETSSVQPEPISLASPTSSPGQELEIVELNQANNASLPIPVSPPKERRQTSKVEVSVISRPGKIGISISRQVVDSSHTQ